MSRDYCVALFVVPLVCLQFVIVVFPDHTHLLFFRVSQLVQFAVLLILALSVSP